MESYLWVPPATKILANFHGCIVTFDGQGFDCWIVWGYMWFHSRSGFLIGSHTGVDIYIYIYQTHEWKADEHVEKIEVASYLSWKKAWSAGKNLHTKARFPITMEIQSCKHFLGHREYTQCIIRIIGIWEVLTSVPRIQQIGTCGAIAAAQTTIYPYLSPKMDPSFPFNIPNGSLGC